MEKNQAKRLRKVRKAILDSFEEDDSLLVDLVCDICNMGYCDCDLCPCKDKCNSPTMCDQTIRNWILRGEDEDADEQ